MERHILLTDIEAIVTQMYEKYRNLEVDGATDPRLPGVDPELFGISVTLADGRTIKAGQTDTLSPLGALSRVPLFAIYCEQKSRQDIRYRHSGERRDIWTHDEKLPEHMPISPLAIRLVSKIEPRNDIDSKYAIVSDMIARMAGTAPELNYKLYESMCLTNEAAEVERNLVRAGFELYDNAPDAIDISTRLEALQLTTGQLSLLGATLAADGRNPVTGEIAFDCDCAPKTVAYMAAKGPHHLAKLWLIKSGLPAMSSFGGNIMGVYPGVLAISAFSPLVNDDGVSIKAYKAIHHIMNHLGLNVFDSARTVIG